MRPAPRLSNCGRSGRRLSAEAKGFDEKTKLCRIRPAVPLTPGQLRRLPRACYSATVVPVSELTSVSQEGCRESFAAEGLGTVGLGGKRTPPERNARDARHLGAHSPAILRAAESSALGCLSLPSLPTTGKCTGYSIAIDSGLRNEPGSGRSPVACLPGPRSGFLTVPSWPLLPGRAPHRGGRA